MQVMIDRINVMFAAISQVLTNFLGSEKAMAALTILIGATALTATGHMTVAEWRETSLWVLGIYTAGKAIQGGTSAIAGSRQAGTDAIASVVEAGMNALFKTRQADDPPPGTGVSSVFPVSATPAATQIADFPNVDAISDDDLRVAYDNVRKGAGYSPRVAAAILREYARRFKA